MKRNRQCSILVLAYLVGERTTMEERKAIQIAANVLHTAIWHPFQPRERLCGVLGLLGVPFTRSRIAPLGVFLETRYAVSLPASRSTTASTRPVNALRRFFLRLKWSFRSALRWLRCRARSLT